MRPVSDINAGNGLPFWPKFSWDLQLAPQTDVKETQEQYATAVTKWFTFHDLIDDTDTHVIRKKLRGKTFWNHSCMLEHANL